MLASVFKNQGFYVGKYETGIAYTDKKGYREYGSSSSSYTTTELPIEQTPVIQANAYPYNWVRCSQAQELASTKFNGGGYTTSLMFGVQWDLVLKYLETKNAATTSKLNSDSTSWGNYSNNTTNVTNSRAKYAIGSAWDWTDGAYGKKSTSTSVVLSTGASSDFGKMGIYDFAGNVYEWTLEYTSYFDYPCAPRGGCYDYRGSYIPASNRDTAAVSNNAVRDTGFRVSLF